LKWDDVNLETGTLRVRRTLSETRTGYIFEPPENGKGRSMKLTQAASEALRSHLERQLEEIDSKLATITKTRGSTSHLEKARP